AAYLAAQARAGAQALMLFESWAGLLAPAQYRQFALRGARRTVEHLLETLRGLDVPLIYYANQASALLQEVRTLPVQVVGVDWRTPLSQVRGILGPALAVQGNLDPAALFAPAPELLRQVDAVLDAAGPRGHIFNLGHGIWPETDPDAVARLIDRVHESSGRRNEG
ncbi:MAG TPA: uroporphyrinogen decarboxylase family protein, partial [Steroidobacteraceae bacterium]|nr:uroporphyrinogen decarboxylase family protein [Steroidobacteraceae bacterium]